MNISPIANIITPFSEKFAIPRQANIVHQAIGKIIFSKKFQHPDILNGLMAHSHYWIIWGFSQHIDKEKTHTVRPPRLGGNQRVGVFSTRSPFRPNNLGLSVVKLKAVDTDNYTLTVSGVDMLSNSPIYDIKPYIPYSDSITEATSEWANDSPQKDFCVQFSTDAQEVLECYQVQFQQQYGVDITSLITELLSYDVRPAYKKVKVIDEKIYATQIYNLDIEWRIENNIVYVVAIKPS